ncbi:MAG: division/cell wall cluster transcriptional repressor MraZ [Spirochaetota bacterium]
MANRWAFVLSGEYRNMLDDKGRLLIPSRLRNSLAGNVLYITRGVEKCLWLMLPDEWNKLSERIMGGPWTMFDAKTRLLQRRIIAPAQECEIDKSGRINIPPTLRDAVGLHLKHEAVILGINTFIELWSVDEYEQYLEQSEKEFAEASQSLSEALFSTKERS